MRPPRRAAVALAVALSPLGTVAGHAAGYRVAGGDAGFGAGHAHLRPGGWVAALVAGGALAWVATSRRAAAARPPLSWLVAGQAVGFVVLEAVERLAGGHGLASLPADPAFRWGLAAQAVAAGLLVLASALARTTGAHVRAVLRSRRRIVPPPSPPARPATVLVAPRAVLRSTVTERGPPRPPAFA